MAEKVISLTQFLLDNPQDGLREDIVLSKRFADAGLKFTISAMSGAQFASYQKEAMALGRRKSISFDSKRFNELVILNHTVAPNFKDADFLKQAGCTSPEQALYKYLRAGEISDLSRKISELSGFDSEPEEMVDEVKNS